MCESLFLPYIDLTSAPYNDSISIRYLIEVARTPLGVRSTSIFSFHNPQNLIIFCITPIFLRYHQRCGFPKVSLKCLIQQFLRISHHISNGFCNHLCIIKKYPEIFHKSAGVATSCPKYCLVKIADSTLALSSKTLASKTFSSDLFIILLLIIPGSLLFHTVDHHHFSHNTFVRWLQVFIISYYT